jgi:siroheme synthase (precorrin-2 oxidase/ferrochelatase)
MCYDGLALPSIPVVIITMGQGGTIILTNSTQVQLNNIDQRSSGMNWNFPASISESPSQLSVSSSAPLIYLCVFFFLAKGGRVQQYVEFVGSPEVAWTDWEMAGLGYRFRIIVQGKYNIRLLNESVPSSTTQIEQSIGIPWRHNGITVIDVMKNTDATYTFTIS